MAIGWSSLYREISWAEELGVARRIHDVRRLAVAVRGGVAGDSDAGALDFGHQAFGVLHSVGHHEVFAGQSEVFIALL